ncbi:hypothetical protein H696_00488 [Fonticula alba]|uniref:Uncharacterized protein n=1 Tax=Fonticula alba TaxID=691883 RepID=A0A058ZEW9_FONAL|nr:hypothetical protein H696_00488 [Fonticula alba]KCV72924.1 hypothetical protein H696_00488 [Fonticula alba]|eukprot:XP_009492625.1 hypothetical protein H696_00488 [Fonticula alba]
MSGFDDGGGVFAPADNFTSDEDSSFTSRSTYSRSTARSDSDEAAAPAAAPVSIDDSDDELISNSRRSRRSDRGASSIERTSSKKISLDMEDFSESELSGADDDDDLNSSRSHGSGRHSHGAFASGSDLSDLDDMDGGSDDEDSLLSYERTQPATRPLPALRVELAERKPSLDTTLTGPPGTVAPRYHLLKLPRMVHFAPAPYNEAFYMGTPFRVLTGPDSAPEVQEQNSRTSVIGMAINPDFATSKTLVANTVRWRHGASGRKESNARFVRWDDGTQGVFIGQQYFEAPSKLTAEQMHLYTRSPAPAPAASPGPKAGPKSFLFTFPLATNYSMNPTRMPTLPPAMFSLPKKDVPSDITVTSAVLSLSAQSDSAPAASGRSSKKSRAQRQPRETALLGKPVGAGRARSGRRANDDLDGFIATDSEDESADFTSDDEGYGSRGSAKRRRSGSSSRTVAAKKKKASSSSSSRKRRRDRYHSDSSESDFSEDEMDDFSTDQSSDEASFSSDSDDDVDYEDSRSGGRRSSASHSSRKRSRR